MTDEENNEEYNRVLKEAMYGGAVEEKNNEEKDGNYDKSKSQHGSIKATPTGKVCNLEINGQNILVPTMHAYNDILEENKRLRAELHRLQSTVKDLTNGYNRMSSELKEVDSKVDGKMDRYDQ